MKKGRPFLYRLYKYSKAGFFLSIIFIVSFVFFFFKKMDMALFPYNDMFSVNKKADTVFAYGLKANGELVKITSFPYWKKDFLETSLNTYVKYVEHDRRVFMDYYIKSKQFSSTVENLLHDRLTPGKLAANAWPAWYSAYAGHTNYPPVEYGIERYSLVLRNGQVKVLDSSFVHLIN
jgi:hypothetical protein